MLLNKSMQTIFEKLDKSEIKMTVTLDWGNFEKYHNDGFRKIRETVEIDGFRKGKAPENLIIKKYGEMALLEEMANLAINETYLSAILKENENKKEEKITPIGQAKIVITKIGKGSEFEYTATFPIWPKIFLPDYKNISKTEIQNILKNKEDKKDLTEITEKEVMEVLENIAKARNPQTHIHSDGTFHHEAHHESDNSKSILTENGENINLKIDDAFAQSFGSNFKTLEDLKNKIKENLSLERQSKLTDKKRTVILEKLISETKIDVPEILIENEFQKMLGQMKNDIQKFSSKWEDYLNHIKKTEDDLKIDWQETTKNRAKAQLILNEIAKEEKLSPTEEEIDVEAIRVIQENPNIQEHIVKNYINQILQNEKVLKMLEN